MLFCLLCVRLILLISCPINIPMFMKKLFLPIMTLSLLCSCGGEEPVVKRPTYDPLIPLVETSTSLQSLAVIALCAEGSAADAASIAYDGECPQEFEESRGRFLAAVDAKLAAFKQGHFVELRTMLYESAATVCSHATSEAGLNAVKNLAKHCSASLYIDGQRACDPPKSVRDRYEAAREAMQVVSLAN